MSVTERVTEFLRQFDRLEDSGGWILTVRTDPDRPEGATLTSADLHEVLKAVDLETIAGEFAERSEKFFETMQSMVGKPDTTPDDIVRYGAYASEAQCAAAILRVRAAQIRSGQS